MSTKKANEVIFHLDENNIAEDIDYYTTSVRDKHGQIKPSDSIYSLLPLVLGANAGGFLLPLENYSFDRIYLGVSMPLFSNAWGTAFLRELLKLIKPEGSIILPVYPEAEAQNKAYWCRSALEDIFRSRELWTGFSNVNAENDGVMSMRVGRKWPKEIPSTANWLMQQAGQSVIDDLFARKIDASDVESHFHTLADAGWQVGIASGICERVLQDYFGSSKPLDICEVGSYGLLASELLSPMARLTLLSADVLVDSPQAVQVPKLHSNLTNFVSRKAQVLSEIKKDKKYNAVFVNVANKQESLNEKLETYWNMVADGGIMVTRSADGRLDKVLLNLVSTEFYYSYAAIKMNDSVTPTHYSPTMFECLKRQASDKKSAFQIFQKA